MKNPYGRKRVCFSLVIAFVVTWCFIACAKQEETVKEPAAAGPALATPPQSPAGSAGGSLSSDLSTAIIEVARKNIPAVAHIEVKQTQEVSNPFLPFQEDPFLRHFFDIPNLPPKFKRELQGLGTGMVIDAQGHILTNFHVVGGATEIQALLSNGKKYKASVVGTDPKTDLAVVKISSAEPLPMVTFGDSDKIQVGEWVVAIGHPRGLDQTVTQGIISAKHRTGITDPASYQDFLQTDAAINPGNSGGPLLNLRGEVVGVNSAIASTTGGFEGIGFTIPSNMAVRVAKALIEHGKVERGWLGVIVQDLTPELAKGFGLPETRGALVSEVTRGGPAEKAGLKQGDAIIEYGGQPVQDASDLRNRVANTTIGQTVKLAVKRKQEKMDLEVQIGDLEQMTKMLGESLKEKLGVTVGPVSPREAQRYGLGAGQGIAIRSLDANSPLVQAGLEVGDVILEVNGQPVESPDSFINLLESVPSGEQIAMLVVDHRTGRKGYIELQRR